MSLPTSAEVKSLTRDDLEYILENYKGRFKTTPMVHQYASILWAMYRRRVLFLHAIGTGKTLSALYTLDVWGADRVLVVSPCSVMKTWVDEIKKHTILCSELLVGPAEVRKQVMRVDFSRFHIVNYEGLKALFGKKVQVKNKKGEVTGNKFVPDFEEIAKSQYDALVFDEVHRLKGWGNLQTEISYHLSRYASNVIMLTGTPVAKDIRDFWSELMVLDDGITLGDNQFEFLHEYMNRVEMRVRGRSKPFYEWFPKKGSVERVVELVATTAIRYETAECVDLPELVHQIRYIDMSSEQTKMTKQIIEGLKVELGEGSLTLKNVQNKASKLAQIASGFIMADNGVKQHKKNPKLDELVDLLFTEISGKCIVFHHYVEVGRMIEERLKKQKIKFRSIRGEVTNKAKQIDDFQTNPDIKVLVAHPQSGGEGLNLQCANVVIFFEQIYEGSTLREQCIGRVWRKGQEETCVIIDFIINDPSGDESIDFRIHGVAKSKKDLAQNILDWVRDS